MEVIRHDYPGDRRYIAGFLSLSKFVHQQAASAPILEDRLSFMGDGAQVIDAAGLWVTAFA
ncbi:hypothetical protein D3C84_998000 [compost metagenome]